MLRYTHTQTNKWIPVHSLDRLAFRPITNLRFAWKFSINNQWQISTHTNTILNSKGINTIHTEIEIVHEAKHRKKKKNSNLCIFIRRVALNSSFILLFSFSFHASISIWWFLGQCHTRLNRFYQCFPIVWSQVNQITDAISWELLCSIFQKLCFIRAHLSGVHLPDVRISICIFLIFHFLTFRKKQKKKWKEKKRTIKCQQTVIRFDSIPCIGINFWLIPIKCVLFGYSLISNWSSFRFDFVLIRLDITGHPA